MPTHAGERARRWHPPTVSAQRLLRGRFTGLTIVLMGVMVIVSTVKPGVFHELGVGFGFSVLVLFAIWSAGRRLRVVTVALAVPALAAHWTLQRSDLFVLRFAGFSIITIFMAFLTLAVLFAVFREDEVTADTIVGAVCAYLLLGVTWGLAYALVALVSPDAFTVSPALAAAAHWGEPTAPLTPLLQYFSFVALSTLGFGDMSPVSGGARTLSVLEGVVGQLYLAILIARLVGMHAARTSPK